MFQLSWPDLQTCQITMITFLENGTFQYQRKKERNRETNMPKKRFPKQLLSLIKHDSHSLVCKYLRALLLTSNPALLCMLVIDQQDINYQFPYLVEGFQDFKIDQLDVEHFSKEELEDILAYMCPLLSSSNWLAEIPPTSFYWNYNFDWE